jgi:hypothetical protein
MSADRSGLNQSDLVSTLRNYLPSSLQRQCLAGQEIRASQACTGHLHALLHTVSTYLPHQVVAPPIADPERSKVEYLQPSGGAIYLPLVVGNYRQQDYQLYGTLCSGENAYVRFALQKQ